MGVDLIATQPADDSTTQQSTDGTMPLAERVYDSIATDYATGPVDAAPAALPASVGFYDLAKNRPRVPGTKRPRVAVQSPDANAPFGRDADGRAMDQAELSDPEDHLSEDVNLWQQPDGQVYKIMKLAVLLLGR